MGGSLDSGPCEVPLQNEVALPGPVGQRCCQSWDLNPGQRELRDSPTVCSVSLGLVFKSDNRALSPQKETDSHE